uniref:Uncharacterized protein n=1 Tax=Magnetospirillum gryphiswaldense TaxID=55518 RepID=A4U0P2_9PROT|nr:hypothetical protein MGR_3175 [Magnetospirillum gryphiswaldense MSR-1]
MHGVLPSRNRPALDLCSSRGDDRAKEKGWTEHQCAPQVAARRMAGVAECSGNNKLH